MITGRSRTPGESLGESKDSSDSPEEIPTVSATLPDTPTSDLAHKTIIHQKVRFNDSWLLCRLLDCNLHHQDFGAGLLPTVPSDLAFKVLSFTLYQNNDIPTYKWFFFYAHLTRIPILVQSAKKLPYFLNYISLYLTINFFINYKSYNYNLTSYESPSLAKWKA
jgi:hypothetical protein